MNEVRLITVDPAHFHAALVHKEMLPGIDSTASVFAPLGPELAAHIQQLAGFNGRPSRPTSWKLEAYAGTDFLQRMLRRPPGNVVVLAGRNHTKIDTMLACVEAGLNLFADKPWIIRHADFPKLEQLVALAAKRKVIVYDMMTERHEITSILQRELIRDESVFGTLRDVKMMSVHTLIKTVAGVPLKRPLEFFDELKQGEGLTGVGTHLVDLVNWMVAPGQTVDRTRDVTDPQSVRVPTLVKPDDLRQITGEKEFPDWVKVRIENGYFRYFCNDLVTYKIGETPVELDIGWKTFLPGGDTHWSKVRGTRSIVRISQAATPPNPPDLDVIPLVAGERSGIRAALDRRVRKLAATYPGLDIADEGEGFRVLIPDNLRVGHEAHFAQVTSDFLGYLRDPDSLPEWEMPNLLTKYYITTRGVENARAR